MIYLDNNATTSLDPEVLKTCIEELSQPPSNPSSVHALGRDARGRMLLARECIAHYFRVRPSEVIFTSGGTESINCALKGLLPQLKGKHIITSSVEHSAVFHTLKLFEKEGVQLSFLNPGAFGAVSKEAIEEAIQPNTALICIMAANNETGVKSDIACIAKLAHQRGLLFFVDAVSLIGKEPFILHDGISMVALSGHKFHAPKGSGCLIVKKGIKLEPLLTGGHQESMRRAGTENLLSIMGLQKAFSLLEENQEHYTSQMLQLRDAFEKGVLDTISDVCINGYGPRIANTSNLSFLGVDGETLLMRLDLAGVLASHGSACSTGALEPSRILINMGLHKERSMSAIRFSFSRMNTLCEIEQTIHVLQTIIHDLR